MLTADRSLVRAEEYLPVQPVQLSFEGVVVLPPAAAGHSNATHANRRALLGHRERTPLMGSHHYMWCQVA